MTPAARLQAAIDILDEIAARRTPADEVARAWGKAHRFAGSSDRRAISERVYAVLRARARLAWAMGSDTGRALVTGSLAHIDGLSPKEIESLFNGEGYAPAPLEADERAGLTERKEPPPEWVEAGVPPFVADALKAEFGEAWIAEAKALIGDRAPLDLRVNSLRGGTDGALSLMAVDDLKPIRTPFSALGLRLPFHLAPDVQRMRAFKSGWVEVQDEASQIACALADAKPGMTVVDYCAGGGGKTLALGAALHGSGRLIACDVSRKRLDAMAVRLARGDVAAEVRQISPKGQGTEDLAGCADLVFVDAPCSGSGTWRRHPEAAWRLTSHAVLRLGELQLAILARAADLVRPGGRLVYATCSVLAAENAEVANAFSNRHPNFRPLPIADAADTPALTDAARSRLVELAGHSHTLTMTPRRTGTDGFFVALFEKIPAERPV